MRDAACQLPGKEQKTEEGESYKTD